MKRLIYALIVLVMLLLTALPVFATDVEFGMDEYYHHESRPHIPSPANQTDVAVGTALTTAGIMIINAVSGTSIFGNVSFNGSFNPAAPPAQAPTPTGASSGSGSGFVGVIKNFFRTLFDNLRDMLTDEGRSYASGRMSEILENITPDDTDN